MAEDVIYARAQPATIELSETYRYVQEVSRNPSLHTGQAPTGRIEVAVPYDGERFFTRQACQDVARQASARPPGQNTKALIGHLALTGYGRTNLKDILDLSSHYGSVPLRVPIQGDGFNSLEHLHADERSCRLTCDYSPDQPEVIPIGITMELLDEEMDLLDELDFDRLDLDLSGNPAADPLRTQIVQQGSFPRGLVLLTSIALHLPSKLSMADRRPRVVRVSLSWPTITSFRGLRLAVGDRAPSEECPVTYNPLSQTIEWGDVAMDAYPGGAGSDVQTYVSKPMWLRIDQPGELYQRSSLEGEVEVEIPGQLLSGLRVRHYNGAGMLSRDVLPQRTTRVSAELRLILGDAFARRPLFHYQHLHFDGVIPNEMRIADIKKALDDRGFRTSDMPLRRFPDGLEHIILAARREGTHTLAFWVFVEGKRYETERQTQVQGGQTYKSMVDSGELKVYVRARLPGDSRILTREVNAFQRALRDRFERLRVKR